MTIKSSGPSRVLLKGGFFPLRVALLCNKTGIRDAWMFKCTEGNNVLAFDKAGISLLCGE